MEGFPNVPYFNLEWIAEPGGLLDLLETWCKLVFEEWGTENRERETGNGEWGMGERGTGNGERGMGNREWGMGK